MGKIAYRRVAPDWEHPRDDRGYYKPLYDGTKLLAHQAEWDLKKQKWDEGLVRDDNNACWVPIPCGAVLAGMEAYYGPRPDPENYSPAWTPEQATAWQVYEETTEGTPISFVYPDLDTMARKIAQEYGHSVEAMRNKILATLECGFWYVPVKEFEPGGVYHGRKFKEV